MECLNKWYEWILDFYLVTWSDETKAHKQEQLVVMQYEQPVAMEETNSSHCIETVHEGKEYQVTRDILNMLERGYQVLQCQQLCMTDPSR